MSNQDLQIKERVVAIVRELAIGDWLPDYVISESSRLDEDLGLDSLDRLEVQMALEEEFSHRVSDWDSLRWKTVSDITEYFKKVMNDLKTV